MTLIVIATSLSAPKMASFFRGRALDQEARRLLSLTHYGQSRAISEGVPVILWIDATARTYGLEIQEGYAYDDPRAVSYEIDRDLTLETTASEEPPPYEDEGEVKSTTRREGIVFLPDGLVDPTSVSRIVVRQGSEDAIALVSASNGLAYELLRENANAAL